MRNHPRIDLLPLLENCIKMEKLNLEANQIVGNKLECLKIKHRIADAKLLKLTLIGDLPL
jgi:hypothetical protein